MNWIGISCVLTCLSCDDRDDRMTETSATLLLLLLGCRDPLRHALDYMLLLYIYIKEVGYKRLIYC